MRSQLRRIDTANQLFTRTRTRTGTYQYQYHLRRHRHRHWRSFWTLSFSAAGHLLPYHLGVAKTLLRNDDHNDDDDSQSQSQSQRTTTTTTSHTSRTTSPHSPLFKVPIHSVVGSSSGAIAATLTTVLSHRLEEYTDQFLQDRGYAFRNLRDMLLTDTTTITKQQQQQQKKKEKEDTNDLVLSICTTRCSDGGIELFSFNTNNYDNKNHDQNHDHKHHRLLKAIEASCRIPRSFHPFDPFSFMGNNLYPDEEGIELEREMEMENDGNSSNNNNNKSTTGYYVDGGIAAPFPSPPSPLLLDSQLQHLTCMGTIVVSPIAGDYYYDDSNSDNTRNSTKNTMSRTAAPSPVLYAIRPRDDSWKIPALFPLASSFQLAGCGPRSTTSSSSTSDNSDSTKDSIGNNNDNDDEHVAHTKLLQHQHHNRRIAVRARLSIQNVRTLITAMGVVPNKTKPAILAETRTTTDEYDGSMNSSSGIGSSGDVLRDWYERGQADAHEFLHHVKTNR